MIRTDAGATVVSAGYLAGSTAPGQSTRRDQTPGAGGDRFGDLVDRYADDAPAPRQDGPSPRVRTQQGTPERKPPQRAASHDAKVAEDTATAGSSRTGKGRVSADEDAQGAPRARRATKDEEVNADAVLTAAVPPASPTVVTGNCNGQAGKSAQALAALAETGVQPGSSGVSAGIAEGQHASALARRAENALAELAGAVQTQEPSNGEGTADGEMPAVHGQAADRPADPARDARRVAIDALRSVLANDAAKTIADKDASPETLQADAAPAKADAAGVAGADKTVGTDGGSGKAARQVAQAAGQDVTVATAAAGESGVENQAGSDAGQPQNDTTHDQHDALADVTTNRTELPNSRGSRTHGSGKQVGQAPQESGRMAHIPTHLGVASEATHTRAGQEGETSVTPKPTARAAQAIAAFQAASMANTTGTIATVHAQVGSPSTTTSAPLDAELPTQIIHAIRVQVDGGTSEARVQLNPGFLGHVSVGVRMEAGSVVASLQASDPQVREWMRNNEPMLRQALADHGLQLERLVIVEEETPSSGDGREEQQEQQQQQQAPRPRRRPSTEGTFELVL